MKIFKRILIASLAVIQIALLASCGKAKNPETPSSDAATTDNPPKQELVMTSYALKDSSDKFKTQGRVSLSDNGLTVINTASGIEFNAYCSGDVTVTLEVDSNNADGLFFTVYVDGRRKSNRADFHISEISGEATLTLATGLDEGNHSFRVFRQTEACQGTVRFVSINVLGYLTEKPADKDLFIEFVGDSITCGYGNLGGNGTPPYQEGTKTYAYLTASALDADFSMFSRSGIGFMAGFLPKTIGEYYPTLSTVDDCEPYTYEREPDIIVVNLGTNDAGLYLNFGYTYDDITPKAEEFVKYLRSVHPDAKIVWCYGMMGPHIAGNLANAINNLGGADNGLYYVTLPTNQRGGDGHPSTDGHSEAFAVLYEFIKKNVLGTES